MIRRRLFYMKVYESVRIDFHLINMALMKSLSLHRNGAVN